MLKHLITFDPSLKAKNSRDSSIEGVYANP